RHDTVVEEILLIPLRVSVAVTYLVTTWACAPVIHVGWQRRGLTVDVIIGDIPVHAFVVLGIVVIADAQPAIEPVGDVGFELTANTHEPFLGGGLPPGQAFLDPAIGSFNPTGDPEADAIRDRAADGALTVGIVVAGIPRFGIPLPILSRPVRNEIGETAARGAAKE